MSNQDLAVFKANETNQGIDVKKVGPTCIDENRVWCQKFRRKCKGNESIRNVCKDTCGLCKSGKTWNEWLTRVQLSAK